MVLLHASAIPHFLWETIFLCRQCNYVTVVDKHIIDKIFPFHTRGNWGSRGTATTTKRSNLSLEETFGNSGMERASSLARQ